MNISTDAVVRLHSIEMVGLLGDHPKPCPHCAGIVRLRDVDEARQLIPHLVALSCTACGADFVLIDVLPD